MSTAPYVADTFAIILRDPSGPHYHTVTTFSDRELWTWLHQSERIQGDAGSALITLPGTQQQVTITTDSWLNDKARALSNLTHDPRLTLHGAPHSFEEILAAVRTSIAPANLYEDLWR